MGGLRKLVAGLAIAAVWVGPAGAQQPPARAKAGQPAPQAQAAPQPQAESAAPASAWAWRCSSSIKTKSGCEMTQVIVDPRNGAPHAVITVMGASDGPSSVMIVRIPHGVYIPAGVTLAIDGAAPTPLPFQKSDQAGIYAALPLTDKLVADLGKGKSFKLAVQVTKGEDFPIVGSLNGFSAALERVKAGK